MTIPTEDIGQIRLKIGVPKAYPAVANSKVMVMDLVTDVISADGERRIHKAPKERIASEIVDEIVKLVPEA